MTPTLASTLVIAGFVAMLGPFAIAAWRPHYLLSASIYAVAVLVGISAYHAILYASAEAPRRVTLPEMSSEQELAAQCGPALQASRRAGLILDQTDVDRPVVSARLWAQLPQLAQQALTACLQATRPGSGSKGPIEIVKQPAR